MLRMPRVGNNRGYRQEVRPSRQQIEQKKFRKQAVIAIENFHAMFTSFANRFSGDRDCRFSR